MKASIDPPERSEQVLRCAGVNLVLDVVREWPTILQMCLQGKVSNPCKKKRGWVGLRLLGGSHHLDFFDLLADPP